MTNGISLRIRAMGACLALAAVATPGSARAAQPGFGQDGQPSRRTEARADVPGFGQRSYSAPTLRADRVARPEFVQTAYSAADADCMSLAIYYEARSESDVGQHAVAQVILNRVRDPNYPDDVCSVVFQGAERRTGCQFSFTCDGSMARLPQGRAWARAREIAVAALSGRSDAPVGNATHYHTRAILPYWAPSLTRVATIGAHIFYRSGRPSSAPRMTLERVEQPVRASPQLSFERVEQVVLAATDEPGRRSAGRVRVNVHRGGSGASR